MLNSKGLRLLIVDDHAILRAGLRRLLGDLPEFSAIGEAADSHQMLEQMNAEPWDMVLLDLDMPGLNSLEALRRVKRDYPDVAVLILSMYPAERFALRALKAGAAGYLNKHSTPQQLVAAVRVVLDGGTFISAGLVAELARDLRTRPLDTLNELLSDREFAVLRGIASGKMPADIARELTLSAKTVSTYRTRVLSKLNLNSNADLVRFAAEHELVK